MCCMNNCKTKILKGIISVILVFVLLAGTFISNGNLVYADNSEVTLSAQLVPNAEIALAAGNTKINYATFYDDLSAALQKKGIDNDNISFVKVDANSQSVQNSFNWWTYDHSASNYGNNVNTNSYISATNETNGNPYNTYNRHIVTTNNGTQMDFYGYGSKGYKDWNFLPNTQATKKVIEFTLDEKCGKDTTYDALDGFGFLINCSTVGTYTNNTQKIYGYLVFMQYNGSTGTSIKLYKLNGVSSYDLHNSMTSGLAFNSNSVANATLLSTATTSYGNYTYRKFKIEVLPDSLKMWCNSSSTSNINVTLTDNDLVKFDGKNEYPLTAEYDTVNGVETFRGGYGPLISYGSHNCATPTHVQLSNLSMTADYVRSLTEVAREPSWNEDKTSFLVNLNEDKIEDFSKTYTTAEIINRLEDDNITYIGWCGKNNTTDSERFVKGLAEGSTLVNMNDSSKFGTDPYSTTSYQLQIDAIADAIATKLKSQYAQDKVYTFLNSDSFIFKAEGAPLDDGNWSVGYDQASFDNASNIDNISAYQNLANASFSQSGYYEVFYNGDYTAPKAKIRVHEAPVARFVAKISENTITVQNKSYDPEIKDNLENADGSEQFGIANNIFEYMNLNDTDNSWSTSAPTNVSSDDTWLIRLTVTDNDGATSNVIQQLSTASTNVAPYGTFVLSSTQYIKNINTDVTIVDQSYALDGSDDFTLSYKIYSGSTPIQTITDIKPGQSYNLPLSSFTEGSYTIKMTATKDGKTSPEISKSFSVVEGYTINYDANGGKGAPSTQYKIKDNELILSKTAPTKVGYHFLKWNTKKDGSGISYNAGDTYKVNENQTLYALWTPVTYEASLDGPNTISEDFGLNKVSYGTEWNASIKPTEAGYYMEKVTVKVNNEELTENQDYTYDLKTGKFVLFKTAAKGPVKVEAVAKGIEYNIKFHGNGGTVGDTNEGTTVENITYGKTYKAPTVNVETNGWTFKGWSRTSDATKIDYKEDADLSKLTSIKNAQIDLYAVWEYKSEDNENYPTTILNGSFEDYKVSGWTNQFKADWNNSIHKWKTTATDNKLEIARPSKNIAASLTHYGTDCASDGEQFAELNGTQVAALYQNIATVPNSTLYWSLDHRARVNTSEKMAVLIGSPEHINKVIEGYKKDGNKFGKNTQSALEAYSDIIVAECTAYKDKWYTHTGEYKIPEGQSVTTFAFVSLMEPATSSCGNLIDNVYLSTDSPKKKSQILIQGSNGGETAVAVKDISKNALLQSENEIFNENLEYDDIIEIEPIAKEGYSFVGAYIDGKYTPKSNFSTKYAVDENVPERMTMVYAKDRTVSLLLDGGTLGSEPLENTLAAENNSTYVIKEPTKKAEENTYNFKGWKIISDDDEIVVQKDNQVVYEVVDGEPYLNVYDTKTRSIEPIYSTSSEDGLVLMATWELDLSNRTSTRVIFNENIIGEDGKITSEDVLKDTLNQDLSNNTDSYTLDSTPSRNGYTFNGWVYQDVYVLAKNDVIGFKVVDGVSYIVFPESSLEDYQMRYEQASEEEKETMDSYYLNDDALTVVAPESLEFYASWEPIQAKKPNITIDSDDNLNLEFGYIEDGNVLSIEAESTDLECDLSYQWYKVALDSAGIETDNISKIDGATNDSYVIPVDSSMGVYNYYCEVTSTNKFNKTSTTLNSNHRTVTVADTIKPTLELSLGGADFWDKLTTSEFSFDKFFKDAKTVIITGDDGDGSGIDKDNIYYYLDKTGSIDVKNTEDIDGINWIRYDDSFKPVIDEDSKYVIYAKVIDKAGNAYCVNSEGIVFDATAPTTTLTEVEYTGTTNFKVIEDNLKSITIDGKEVSPDGEGNYQLIYRDTPYIIDIEDKSGLTYYKEITINELEVTVPVIEPYTYTGKQCAPDVENTDEYTVVDNNGGIDAGKYNLVLKLNDLDSAKWIMDNNRDDYKVDEEKHTVTITYEIEQASNEFIDKLECENFVYDGITRAKATVSTLFGNTDISIKYYKDKACKELTSSNDGAIEKGGAPKNAGTYYVRAVVEETNNYEGLTSDVVKFTISKNGTTSSPTGDKSDMGVWIMLLVLAAGTTAVAYRKRIDR